jgi:hypothetical protein
MFEKLKKKVSDKMGHADVRPNAAGQTATHLLFGTPRIQTKTNRLRR